MFMTPDQSQLEGLGIDQTFTPENTDIRMVEFYVINLIYSAKDKNLTWIGSNGDYYCCHKPVNQVSNLIYQNL